MNNSVYFSVILPTYNRVEFIEQAIESVKQQIFEDWELFIINDNSTDATQQIISKYEEQNINIINLESNSGVSHARNYALNMVSGKYVTFLDDDDLFAPSFLQTLHNQILLDKGDYDFYWTGVCFLESKGIRQPNSGSKTIWAVDSKDKENQKILIKKIAMSHGICIKIESLKEVGFFDEKFISSEDKDLFLRMIRHGFSYKSIASVQIYRRTHDYPQLSHNSNNAIRVESAERIIAKHLDYLNTNKSLLKLLQKSLARKYFRANKHAQGRRLMWQMFKGSMDIRILIRWAKLEIKYPLS